MNLRYLIPPVAQRAKLETGHARPPPAFLKFFQLLLLFDAPHRLSRSTHLNPACNLLFLSSTNLSKIFFHQSQLSSLFSPMQLHRQHISK